MAAVFFDIDGTIWDAQSMIPESTVTALRRLRMNGHRSFLCSGRSRVMIFDPKLFALEPDGVLAGCGTYIEFHGEEVYNRRLDAALLRETIAILKRHRLPALIEGSCRLFMDEAIYGDPFGAYLKNSLGDKVLPLDGSEALWDGNKLTVMTNGREYRAAAGELSPMYEILQHGDYVMELVPKGFSKATGIQKVCELMNIPHGETYAVGDSVNDCDMLRYAACGIAMGNGTDAAKDAADYVTEVLHADGLYHALAHFGLI